MSRYLDSIRVRYEYQVQKRHREKTHVPKKQNEIIKFVWVIAQSKYNQTQSKLQVQMTSVCFSIFDEKPYWQYLFPLYPMVVLDQVK